MKDLILEELDDQIDSCKRYCEDYACDMNTLLRLVSLMDRKVRYISKNPKKAESHYNRNTDKTFVKDTRKRLSMTQEAFAKSLGVSRGTVNRWESGKLPLSFNGRDRIDGLLKSVNAFRFECANRGLKK